MPGHIVLILSVYFRLTFPVPLPPSSARGLFNPLFPGLPGRSELGLGPDPVVPEVVPAAHIEEPPRPPSSISSNKRKC